MYSKQQASHLRQEFWTAFGKYMQPVLSASGEKINWVNYKTGVKHIQFRMDAGKGASIAIEFSHPDLEQQTRSFELLVQMKTYFESIIGEKWTWVPAASDDTGRIVSRVYTELNSVHIFNKADWPQLISFFKPRMIALDNFWNDVRHGFEV